jgi:hypothetical protein
MCRLCVEHKCVLPSMESLKRRWKDPKAQCIFYMNFYTAVVGECQMVYYLLHIESHSHQVTNRIPLTRTLGYDDVPCLWASRHHLRLVFSPYFMFTISKTKLSFVYIYCHRRIETNIQFDTSVHSLQQQQDAISLEVHIHSTEQHCLSMLLGMVKKQTLCKSPIVCCLTVHDRDSTGQSTGFKEHSLGQKRFLPFC